MAGFFSKVTDTVNGTNAFKTLAKLSNMGLKFNDEVIRNSKAVGVTVSQFGNDTTLTEDMIVALKASDMGDKKFIAIFDKEYKSRREFLRKFAMNGEIEWILDTICDESIVYDENNFFCYPIHNLDSMLKPEIAKEVTEKLQLNFKKLYTYHHFHNGILAWQLFKQFIIDGFLAFEIMYDKEFKNIIGFQQLDALSLTPSVQKDENGNYVRIWIQNQGEKNQKILMDTQIIYLSYAKGNYVSRVSYTERLVRSHNLLRLMEHTRAIWNLQNATYRLKMVVPVGSASKQRSQEMLGELQAQFKEDIYIDNSSGEVSINGRAAHQFYRNYIVGSRGGDAPEIEVIAGEGPELNDTDIIDYFYKKLKIDSKIPMSRFDREGGASFSISADGLEREEVRFNKFIIRLRTMFNEILVKPLYIQMCLDIPELANDDMFRAGLNIRFHNDNLFEEFKEMEVFEKRIDFISNMLGLEDANGDPFFNSQFLIEKYLKMSPDDMLKNESYKIAAAAANE